MKILQNQAHNFISKLKDAIRNYIHAREQLWFEVVDYFWGLFKKVDLNVDTQQKVLDIIPRLINLIK